MSQQSFPAIAILVHIYYPDTYKYLINKLSIFGELQTELLVNICRDTPYKQDIIDAFKKEFPSAHFISTTNIGKDIGGKIALIALLKYLNIQSEWLLLIHDKKSPQSVNGERWREELYKILEGKNLSEIYELMKNKSTGIIGSKEFIVTYTSKNKNLKKDPNYQLLNEQAEKLKLNLKDFSFVGGTTFWIRKQVLDNFFQHHDPLLIRKDLEEGNVIDNFTPKLTHTWERLFGLITVNQPYKVIGF